MKKITLFFILVFCGFLFVSAQTTLEVGADKTYTTIKAAWDAAKSETATEIIINVAEGTYTEAEMNGAAVAPATATMTNKKITIIGAGADRTFISRSSTITNFDFSTTGVTVNPGRVFQLNNAVAAGIDLSLQKITFRLIGFTNTNGGAVINGNQAGQKFSFKDCNFNNIMARIGAVIQAGGGNAAAPLSPDIQVNFENCFFQNCSSIDNSGQDGIIKVTSGTLNITNCNFYNNTADVFNRVDSPAGTNGTDRNLRAGSIIGLGGNLSAATITDCNFANNSTNATNLNFIHPVIAIKPAITALTVAPNITIDANPSITMINVISVGNGRATSLDGDLLYDGLMNTPSFSNSIFNVAKKFDANATPISDVDVVGISGLNVNPAFTTSTYFEMEGDAPKIVTNSLGVKSFVRKVTDLKYVNDNNLKVNVENGKLTISSDKPENIEIYNSIGSKIGQFLNTNNVQINLSNGIYIVKNSTFSTKVLVR